MIEFKSVASYSKVKNDRGEKMIRATHGACTHVGQVRRDNEDAFVAIDGLYVVADGMGGHSAGEVASALAVATLKDAFLATQPGLKTPEQVAEAVALANTTVFIEALEDSSKSGMGTTLTGMVITDAQNNEVIVANVGDSRTYLWRKGELQQVTKDHSHVQTLVDRGAITQQEARTHYQRNIVLRAIGIDAEVHVDIYPVTIEDGDRFIMCSDGLVDEADDDEIISEIQLRSQPQELAERLVDLANANGGRDNVTVVVVDFAVVEEIISEPPTAETPITESPVTETSSTENSSTEKPVADLSAIEPSNTEANSTVQSIMSHRRAPMIAIISSVVAVLTVIVVVITAL